MLCSSELTVERMGQNPEDQEGILWKSREGCDHPEVLCERKSWSDLEHGKKRLKP